MHGAKTAETEIQLFLTLLPATSGTESPFSGDRTCWLPASWFPFVPMKEELNQGSRPFSQPFLSQIAQRQVVQVVLLGRWRSRKQASPYRRSKEPVFLWMRRGKGGPKGGRCTRQGTQAPQSLVHNTKSCSHSLPLQNPFPRPLHLPVPVPLSHSLRGPAVSSWHLQLVLVYVSLPIYIF